MNLTSKQDIMAKKYYDPSGCSSKANTLKESEKTSITKKKMLVSFSARTLTRKASKEDRTVL